MAIHELARNSHIQYKLYQDIKGFKEMEYILTYDNVSDLKYLDSILNGTVFYYYHKSL